ncbi:MAG TPA: hypothetical protein VM580_20130 [Labilithrix sp.]|nr:hypothetical protein [Labilithrix sp.]
MAPIFRISALLVVGTTILACGGEDPSASATASSSGTSGSSGSSGSSGTLSGSSGGSSSGGEVVNGIPTDPAGLNAWLQTRAYQAWPQESAPRPYTRGAGGHSGDVRTYLNPTLDESMQSSNEEHPKGSAAVKEFLSGGKLTGWAAYVKTEDSSNGGKGWYWYEVFDVTPGSRSIGGQGSGICTGCHSAGRDFVRVPYPLQ